MPAVGAVAEQSQLGVELLVLRPHQQRFAEVVEGEVDLAAGQLAAEMLPVLQPENTQQSQPFDHPRPNVLQLCY